MKHCSVCRRVYDLASFTALSAPRGGELQEDGDSWLLLRNCATCNTTLALPVEELPVNLRPKTDPAAAAAARLDATAPLLLALLKECLERSPGQRSDWRTRAETAIAAAEGRL